MASFAQRTAPASRSLTTTVASVSMILFRKVLGSPRDAVEGAAVVALLDLLLGLARLFEGEASGCGDDGV
jgi:hypothetical protein